ncbi:MAG TPA: DUF2207 domain-containing protein [Propionibacteriaceae bacterium]|nr:DUF2207 domain-containing protein [Propionibacteriaceae bacterium]
MGSALGGTPRLLAFHSVRVGRVVLSVLFAVALGLMVGAPIPASAANGDEIESFEAAYVVEPSGILRVKETIRYHFGSSGRHGIERVLVTREPQGDQDAVYDITNVTVTTPDRGVSTRVSRITGTARQGREKQLTLRIGDPDIELSRSTATYVLSYDVAGTIRSFAGYDELSWDATGLDWSAPIRSVKVRAKVPGGAQELTCFYGKAGSKTPCRADIVRGVGQFSQANVPEGQGVSVGVKIRSGLVSDNKPHLEPDASKLSPQAKVGLAAAGVGGLGSLVGAPLLGLLWWRRNGRDQRYAGLPPGTVPLRGQPAQVVHNDPDLPIPVAFSPPRIPVAEAGLLIDGQVDTRETAATIIDLAVRGGLRVQSTSDDEFLVTLLDPSMATAPHEMALLTHLFESQPPGAVVDLSAPGSLQPAHEAMRDSVISQVATRGWFREVPSATAARGIGIGGIAIGAFILFSLGPWLLLALVPLLPILITIAVVRFKLRRGQRTPDGRAMCDQVEGFKTYLATAEADQLRFEEGEDIFSRYLPWAIAFDLADRWAKICGDLVAMGRLPAEAPYWYYGSFNMYSFNAGFLTSSLNTAASPAPVAASSGTGFGGGSSFGGGGFSGGGGGGGGGGSW